MFHLLFSVYCEIRSTASEQLSLRHHFANILYGGEKYRDVARALKRGGPPFFLGQILFVVVIRMC